MFTRRQAVRWAELWLACWNDRDFDTLLALYRDDASFEGSFVAEEGGELRVDRREALKRHWAAVPCGIHASAAELDRVSFDPESRELTIVYIADLDGARLRGCDLLTLDDDGRVISGEPCVGCLDQYAARHGTFAHASAVAIAGDRR